MSSSCPHIPGSVANTLTAAVNRLSAHQLDPDWAGLGFLHARMPAQTRQIPHSANAFTEKSLDLAGTFEVESRLVATQSFSDAVITDHAEAQMRRRGIEVSVVRKILLDPEQVLEVRQGRVVLQSRVIVDNRSQLVRIFVDVDESPMRVVTVYRTSKVDKYWSRL